MATLNCYFVMRDAYKKAIAHGLKETNVFHLFIGILNIKTSPVTLLLNKYGITYDWVDKIIHEKYGIKDDHIDQGNECKDLFHSKALDLVLGRAAELANEIDMNLDINHIAFSALEIPSQFLMKVKNNLTFNDFTNLRHDLKKTLYKKNDKFVNQVTIE